MRFSLILLLVLGSSPVQAIDLEGQTDFARRLNLNSSVSARVDSIKVSIGQQVGQGELLLMLGTTSLQAHADMAGAEVDALAPEVERMLGELEKAQELFDRDSLALVALQHAEQNYAIAEARLKAAQAKLTNAQYRLSQAEIRAPFDGVILSIVASPGQYINTRVSDQTLLAMADNKNMVATTLLPVEQWKEDLLYRSARVSFRKQSYPGRVVAVGQEIVSGDNRHPAITVIVSFETDGKLAAGLGVKITIADK